MSLNCENKEEESFFKFNLNPRMGSFWHDEQKLRRAVEIYGSVVPRKRALELISEETGVSLRTAKNFGSKILNSNEFDAYIKELHSRPDGKETYCYFNHLSNNRKYYDVRPVQKLEDSNVTNNISYVNEDNLYADEEEEDYFQEDQCNETNSNTDNECVVDSSVTYNYPTSISNLKNGDAHTSNGTDLKEYPKPSNRVIHKNGFKNESHVINHQLTNLNEKLDFLVTNIKQINSSNKYSESKLNSNEPTEENNICLSSNLFKSLMQCKQCPNQFSVSLYPKRAIKCGHSICIKCYQNLSENNSDETIILNCPFCHLDTLWSNNMDLIIILEEVHKNTTVHYLDEIAKINSSELSENYSKNFQDIIKIALDDFEKLSYNNQVLIYNIIKRKYIKECQINQNPKRIRFN